MSTAKSDLVNGWRRSDRVLSHNVQDESVSGVRPKEKSVLRNARVIRHEVLDSTQFFFHNAHLQSGKEPPKNCNICNGRLEKLVTLVEQEFPGELVGESAGTDEEGSTSHPPNSKFWPWD